ncbi:MAG: sodium:proton antiporter [Gammaproteobacteria bacterium]|nr:sodium:proton antiporter [Gammaproteobacteria bacterium]
MNDIPQWLSLLPPIVALVFVLWRKEVVSGLLLGLFTSELLLTLQAGQFGLFTAFLNTIERAVAKLSEAGNARLILFSLLIGVLLAYMRFSGGVAATVNKMINAGVASTARRTGMMTFGTGVVVFLESNLSVLTAGIVSRGLFDKFKMSRERLAYIIDSTSAPICILIFLNGWGAFVMGLIAPYELAQTPVSMMIGAATLNVYALSTLALVFYTVWTGKVYGPLATVEQSLTTPQIESEQSVEGRARDMLVPLVVLVVSMIFFMYLTGNQVLIDKGQSPSVIDSILSGSGGKSVLYATILATLVSFSMLVIQPRFNHQTLMSEGFKGMSELLPLVAILFVSICLGASVRELGTGEFISGLVASYLPLWIVPAIVFIAGAFASFTTGTSWGTFALMVPIAMPISINLGISPELMLAAVLGGGVFGDHCSPVSDTTAVSSLAAGCDLLSHVKTQLPYAASCGLFTVVVYLLLGVSMI